MTEIFAGRYRLLRLLGRGGMGEVFLARDLAHGGECALKRLGTRSASAFEAVRREFELLTRLRHPAVVSVLEFGTSPEGTPYYTMEYVPGVPADQAITPGRREALFFFAAEVAAGLEALHGLSVFHGDVKPTNLLVIPGVDPEGPPAAVRLLDFGLGAALGNARGHRGTAGYAAPEVVEGAPIGPAADLYGLGSTLYALCTGKRAFSGDDANDVLRNQKAGPPRVVPLEEAAVPERLVRLILRLMAPDPRERPQNAREVRRELESMHPAACRPLDVRVQTAVFVGRERELAVLEQRLAAAGARPRVVVVTGEPGIGKTALLRELVLRWSLAGRPVVHIPCGLLQDRGAPGLALYRRFAAEAGDVVTGEGPGLLGESELDRLVESAIAWQRRIVERSGTPVVLLDDVDHLDAASRAFVRRLVLHPSATAGLWLWSRRAVAGEPLEDERALIEAGAAESLELAPLERSGMARLVAARLNVPVPRDLEEFLWRRARGHSGLTVELLRFAAGRGVLRESDAGFVLDHASLEALELPPTYEALLAVRYEALSPGGRVAAAALAVLGRPAVPGKFGAIGRFIADRALEEVVDSGLAIRDATGAVMLASPAFAERLAALLPCEVRESLHLALLEDGELSHAERFRHLEAAGARREALEAANAAYRLSPDSTLAARAARLAESAAPELAAEWHERAGRELSKAGRYRAAIGHLERALAGAAPGEERHERGYLLSTALLRGGEREPLEKLHAAVLDSELPDSWRARFQVNEASRVSVSGNQPKAEALALEALALANRAADDEGTGLAAQALAYLWLRGDRHAEAEAMARRSVEAFERAGNERSRLRSIGALAEVSRARHQLGAAERLYREALATARAQGLRIVVEELLVNLAVVLDQLGRWVESREMYAEAARLALEDQRPRGAAVAFANLAQIDGLVGRGRLARKQARAAIRLARAYHPRFESVGWRSLSQGHRVAGQARGSVRAAQRALDLAIRNAVGEEVDWCRVELGRSQAEGRGWSEALVTWRQGLADEERQSGARTHAPGYVTMGVLAGRAALRAGDLTFAQARLAFAEDVLAGRHYPYLAALTAQLRAEIALVRNRIPEAITHVDRAIDAFVELRASGERALALLEFGRLALEPKLPYIRRAGDWIAEAVASFARLGNRRGRVRALEMQVEWLKRAGSPSGGERRERDLIDSVSRLLHSLSDLKELTQRAMQLVVEQLDATRGVLLLEDQETGELVSMAEHGELDSAMRSSAAGYSRQVVERVRSSGGSLLIQDAPSDPTSLSESMEALKLRSIVCVPMFIGGRVIGTVYLDDSRRAQAFDEEDRALLEGFAHMMAIAIDKSRGEEEVRRANEMLVGENLSLRQEAGLRFQADRLIGTSLEMQRVRAIIDRLAQHHSTVLLTGENGTGKELIARIVHHTSRRRLKPFVAINCGAIPETLLESELFGILNNVATNVRARDGRFKQADGGTLFLDEIGDMPLKQQVALLAAIANREITPVGGGKPIPVDVRIIAATNRDLGRMVAEGTFREDLYFRLNVIPIEVPPLRNRKSDVPMLTRHFVGQFARLQERPVPELSNEFVAALMQSDWAGNVRELQNYIERVMAMNPGDVLYPSPLPRDLEDRGTPLRAFRRRGLTQMVEELERKAVQQALEHARGNQSLAARQLGITEQSMRYRIRKYKLGSARQNQRVRRFRH